MASPFQQQALQRKLIYIGLIVALFTVAGAFRAYVVEAKAEQLALREQNLGEVEVGGSALRLSLTGSRGFVVCALWTWAIDAQKKNRWNELELYVDSLTRLQPHFISPWLFQSWNLAYNVSVESDQVKDKYFYVSRGVQLLEKGERQNRNHPDMRFNIGMYQQHKICQSDETNVFRSLWQMSVMDPRERDPARFYTKDDQGRDVFNLQEFGRFCDRHPQLVRRLRDKLRCDRPEKVVQFLADNQRIPTLYEDDKASLQALREGEEPRRKEKVLDRFPVLPPPHVPEPPQRRYLDNDNELTYDSPRSELGDAFDGYAAARAWYAYAQEPIPPTRPDVPGRPEEITDRVRQRLPQMTTSIFRNWPPRAQSAVAERLEQEGWFDESGWLIADWFPRNRLTRVNERTGKDEEVEARVGGEQPWALDAWAKALEMWKRRGEDDRLLLPKGEEEHKRDLALRYLKGQNLTPASAPLPPPPGLAADDPRMEDYAAAVFMHSYDYYRSMTNFPTQYERAHAESQPETVKARKAFFEAAALRAQGRRDQALRRYEAPEALEAWRTILQKYEGFGKFDFIQEEAYEFQLKYMRLLDDLYSRRFRLHTSLALVPPGPAHGWTSLAYLALLNPPSPVETAKLLTDPKRRLDAPGKDGRPAVVPDIIVEQVEVRRGLRRKPQETKEQREWMMKRMQEAGMSMGSPPPGATPPPTGPGAKVPAAGPPAVAPPRR
jgi:hypothetical protein